MAGIPANLMQRLKTTLLRCGPFDDDGSLRAIFADARINQWRNTLPNATSPADRVQRTIDHLSARYNRQGENALVLLLRVLCEYTPVDDQCCQEFAAFAAELEQYAPTPDTPQWDAAINRYREWIKGTYGTMRVLGKPEPVLVEGIYTDVYLLEQPAASRYVDPNKSLDRTRGKRQDGLKLVMQSGNERLVILGQPGAGKTTFLKHIALQAADGKVGDRVPILVYLREWVGGELMDFVTRPLNNAGIADPPVLMEHLLHTGGALLLLDGLDEVNEPQRRDLIWSIEEFHRDYMDCRILLTCRVAAIPHQFEGFSEVEVADFTYEQMSAFARNWFGEDTTRAKDFQEQIQRDEHLRDLGRTPLLLGMLCLTFDEQGTFPKKHAELYQRGLEALLAKWDEARSIERKAMRWAEIYHNLSLGRKHQLFAHIAHETFEQGEMLISQQRLECLITEYLVTVPNAPARIDMDAHAVIKAIEAQHGILVEYAQRVYAFAHPTFQEYYVAHYNIWRNRGGEIQVLPSLLTHAAHDRWREVILLTASMMDEADDFFAHFLNALNAMVRDEDKLVNFLTWAQRKAATVTAPYKPATVRAYCAYIALNLEHERARYFADNLVYALDRDRSPDNALVRAPKLEALSTALEALVVSDKEADPVAWIAFAAQLEAVMITQGDFGHDGDFTDQQIGTLYCYLTAAHLLIECLDVSNITAADRAAIEDHLLLPPSQGTEAL